MDAPSSCKAPLAARQSRASYWLEAVQYGAGLPAWEPEFGDENAHRCRLALGYRSRSIQREAPVGRLKLRAPIERNLAT